MKRIELEVFRTRKQLTQKEMANKLSISESLYCMIENAQREPTFSLLERFNEVFGDEYLDIFNIFKKIEK